MASEIEKLYKNFDPNKLVDIEELDFPADVETYSYNLPQPAAFTEYVVPGIEKLLKKKAEDSIANQNTRRFSIGGTNIQKETVRVFLGLYRVVFKYDGKEYSVWITGDGEKTLIEELPADTERQKTLDELKQAKANSIAAIPVPKTGLLMFGLVVCILGAGLFLLNLAGGAGVVSALLAVLFLAGAIACGVSRSKRKNAYTTQRSEIETKHQKEMAEFEGQAAHVVQQFKEQKKALRGAYEEVTDDADAFPA